jgi:hypothetical protein
MQGHQEFIHAQPNMAKVKESDILFPETDLAVFC